jgi:uncharacterized protein
MLPPLPAAWSAVIVVAVMVIGWLELRFLLPSWWRARSARRFACLSWIPLSLGLLTWTVGDVIDRLFLSHFGAVLTWAALVPIAFAVLSLPIAAAVVRLGRVRLPLRSRADHEVPSRHPGEGLNRRSLLQACAAAIPIASLMTGADGFASASAPIRIPLIRARFSQLPPDLDGLRILLLSDLHLGVGASLQDVEDVLLRSRAFHPDLVVVTGDVADRIELLAPALELIAQHAPRLGAWSVLGNHEYLHGISATRPVFERSRIPLLVNRCVAVPVGEATLVIAGIDDPIASGTSPMRATAATVSQALSGSTPDCFRILLSHRPCAFVAASRHGVDLTLAGHTHGGQVGVGGHSVLEHIHPEPFVWGTYRRGNSVLYTTSGFGHWFPFRLNCPAEAPVIELATSRGVAPAT